MQRVRSAENRNARFIKSTNRRKIESLERRILLSAVSFSSQATYGTDSEPYSVAVADLGNGHPDIVTANVDNADVSVLLGNGDGTFQSKTNYATGTGPDYVAIADLGNGHPDIVVTNQNSNTISVLLGYGNGTFYTQQTYATGPFPDSIAIADLGNGHPDIIVTDGNTNTVSVFLGNGDGTFQSQETFTTSSDSSAQPDAVAVADLGNGHPDLIVTNRLDYDVAVLLGNGSGTSFQSPVTYATGELPHAVAVANLGNGIEDLVVANDAGNTSDTVSVLLGNGNGTFQSQTTYSVGSGATALAVADLGNGQQDVVVANYQSDTLSVLLGNGDGTFQSPQTLSVGSGPSSVAIANLGNGVQDLIVANSLSNNVGVLLGSPPPAPDLQLANVSYSAGSYEAGSALTVSGTQENTGNAAAGAYDIEAVLSTDQTFGDSNNIALGTIEESGLAGDGSQSFSIAGTIPAGTTPGNYYLLTKIDSTNSVAESNESNNVFVSSTANVTVTAVPPPPPGVPDLQLANVSYAAGSYLPGASLSVTGTQENTGSGSAGAYQIEAVLSTDQTFGDANNIPLGTINVGGLGADSSQSFSVQGIVPSSVPAGDYFLLVKIDSGNSVAEGNENNNVFASATANVVVTAVPPPPVVLPPPPPSTTSLAVDTSFGSSTGAATLPFTARAETVDASGNILVAGYEGDPSSGTEQTALERLTADGALDPSFGSNGMVVGAAGSGAFYSVAVESNGDIVAGGSTGSGQMLIQRFTSSGSPDGSFGSAGIATANLGSGSIAYSLAIDSSSDIVAAGTGGNKFAVARFTSSGVLDTTFNSTGTRSFNVGSNDVLSQVLIQTDGKILLAGGSGANDVIVARLNSNGSFDSTFGSGTPSAGIVLVSGLVPTDISPGVPDASIGLALESSGAILVANQTADGHFGLVALTSSGQIDSAFGTGGLAEANFGGTDDADAISINSSTGEILVAGTTDAGNAPQTALAEFLPNGSADSTFGQNGTLTMPLADTSSGTASSDIARPDAYYGKDFYDQAFLAQQNQQGTQNSLVLSSRGPQAASTLVRLAPATIVTPTSTLEVSLSGNLPGSGLVAGQKIKPISQTVRITNPTSSTVSGTFTIQLLLSVNTAGNSADPSVASVTRKLTLKAGKSASVPITFHALPAGISGSQYVLADVTDPAGKTAVGASAGTIGVQAGSVDLSGSFVHVPSTGKVGRSVIVSLAVTEAGNVPVSDALPVQLLASSDGTLANAISLETVTKRVSIQAGHKQVVQFSVPLGTLAAGSYTLIAKIDPLDSLSDADLANNVVFSTSPIVIG